MIIAPRGVKLRHIFIVAGLGFLFLVGINWLQDRFGENKVYWTFVHYSFDRQGRETFEIILIEGVETIEPETDNPTRAMKHFTLKSARDQARRQYEETKGACTKAGEIPRRIRLNYSAGGLRDTHYCPSWEE